MALFMFIGFITINPAEAAQPLILVTDDDFPPYSWSENNEAVGIDVEIVEELCLRINETCTITPLPWKRALLDVKQGKADAIFSAFKTPDRLNFTLATDAPIHYSTHYVFVKKGHEFEFDSVDDLYGLRIGKNRGFAVSAEFDSAVATGMINIYESASAKNNIGLLIHDRIDGFVANYHEALYSLRDMVEREKISYLTQPVVESRGAYLLISKTTTRIIDKKAFMKKVNKSLKAINEDGSVDRINKKYLGLP